MAYEATCQGCGIEMRGEVIMPTSGQVGEVVAIGMSCRCGRDAFGTAALIEVWPAEH